MVWLQWHQHDRLQVSEYPDELLCVTGPSNFLNGVGQFLQPLWPLLDKGNVLEDLAPSSQSHTCPL